MGVRMAWFRLVRNSTPKRLGRNWAKALEAAASSMGDGVAEEVISMRALAVYFINRTQCKTL